MIYEGKSCGDVCGLGRSGYVYPFVLNPWLSGPKTIARRKAKSSEVIVMVRMIGPGNAHHWFPWMGRHDLACLTRRALWQSSNVGMVRDIRTVVHRYYVSECFDCAARATKPY